MNKTKMIATVGPSSKDYNIIKQMIHEGADVIRINMSYASFDFAREVILSVRDINIKENTINGMITDTKEDVIDNIKKNSILKIGIVEENYLESNYLIKVYEWMYYEIRRKRLIVKNPKKRINDSLKIVGLNDSYLNRNRIHRQI